MPKTLYSTKAECIVVNLRKIGGNVLFAVGVKTDKANKTQATARKVMNFQTDNTDDLKQFAPGQVVTITIEQ